MPKMSRRENKKRKRNKKKGTLVISLADPKVYKKLFKAQTPLTEEQFKAFDKRLSREARDLKRHFKEDGWDINASLVQDSIVGDVLGSYYGFYIFSKILKATGTTLNYTDKGFLFTKKEGIRKNGKRKARV